MRHELRLFFIALQFFTRVPIPRWVGFEPAWLNESARHFPLVGTLVGAVTATVFWLAALVFPQAVAVGLSMAAGLVLTGAFHEDGLADTFDALGGAVSRERALEIMKDSRIGSYGAVALVMVLGLKWAVLASLPPLLVVAVLVFAHTASRAAAVLLIRALPYAGDVALSKAKPLAQRVSAGGCAVALTWVGLVALALLVWTPLWWSALAASTLGGAVIAAACGWWFHRRLGGITGDTLGATQQLVALGILLAWLAWVPLVFRWS
ncbi:MAG: hypothetical protein RLZZ618_609 [Pseudomonadota bacterium]|jgi:adenosylcobinamide-GDP ribazoletransferase